MSKLVNILTKGPIPWIGITGPVFGYVISDGAAQILANDPRVIIERTTPEKAKLAKAEYLEKLKGTPKQSSQEPVGESVSVDDDFSIELTALKKPVEKDADDSDIDAILNDMNINTGTDDIFSFNETADVNSDKAGENEKKVYSKEQLSVMTKRQLKGILRERGYFEGPNAGKYHDTVVQLIDKVLRTQ